METYEEMDRALQQVSSNVDTDEKPLDPAESARLARERGWAEPIPYDYQSYGNKDARDWAGIAARYEWQDEYGDVGPRNPDLEQQLFHHEYITRVGHKLAELNAYEVKAEVPEGRDRVKPILDWESAGLHPIVRENISLCLYERPTAIQSYAVPAILTGRDVIGIAQTGSGKTGAFLIPILSKLMGKAKKLAAPRPYATNAFVPAEHAVRAEPLVMIICPTRELSTQIFDEARRLCYRSMLRPCVAYGGAPVRQQREELQKGCDILIGTPGRIMDFMNQVNVLSLKRVRYTVIDEADELLQSDWEDDFRKIISGGDVAEDGDHTYMMFSATFNKECRQLARTYLGANWVRVRIGRAGSSHLNVLQEVIYVEESQKKRALHDLLVTMVPIRTLIFANTKDQVDIVDDFLYNHGMPVTSIHSGRTQGEREDAIRAFRTAKCPIMVATGLSARGLDIVNVMHIINFDLPKTAHGGINEYIHRIGRTARIGNEGIATSFYSEKDSELASDLVKILLECKQKIPDFLENYIPPDQVLDFDDDTDEEINLAEDTGNADAAADPWGQSEEASNWQVQSPAVKEEPVDAWGEPSQNPAKGSLEQSSWGY
ncbi:hypothetical protein NUU61_000559 [Penicillium alfredii]|uniref:RNA helicase n=1 Tax=Penicillium alfredii TaxID=1506179 RepID=A0A9W9GB69_9EURO|nr:uncharacterized protein NUU61_000559 [Penicillium alfredii]KAJ5114800.1 hypothetical protein NUU61_000559 [Penicillium alfredii]